MNTLQRLEAVAREKAGYQSELNSTFSAIDQAANDGDRMTIKALQADAASLQSLIESCDRRAEKLRHDMSAEGVLARCAANDANLEAFAALADSLPKKARKVMQAADKFIAELQGLRDDGNQAGKHFRALIGNTQGHFRDACVSLISRADLTNEEVGNAIVDHLAAAGLFDTLAPTHYGKLQRLHMQPLDAVVGQLLQRSGLCAQEMRDRANASIQGESHE
jgi:hypothetical protein